MTELNRRTFIKNFLLATGTIAISRSPIFAQGSEITGVPPFEMLAIGDSVMWGQGLKAENKFSFRVKNWLEIEVLPDKRKVNLFVAAHSGATIEFKREDGFDPLKTYSGEINISSPSITQQADDAFSWYKNGIIPSGYEDPLPKESGKRLPESLEYYNGAPVLPDNVDLILVDGGINDTGAANLVDPRFSRDKLISDAKTYCGSAMENLLKKLYVQFPNARIVVTGYFPLISKKTSPTVVYDAVVEIFGKSSFTEFLKKTGRKLSRAEIEWIHPFRNYLAKNSSIWAEHSNYNLRQAVNNLNDLYPFKDMSGELSKRAFFAKPHFEKKNAYGAEESFLWMLKDKIKTDDEVYDERKKVCNDNGLQGLNQPGRFVCNRAALFHPNEKGANSYFQSIKNELGEVVKTGVWKVP